METLIAKLEGKITELVRELELAQEEIRQLKEEGITSTPSSAAQQSASLDLLSGMTKRSTEDQLKLYIEDSLDLLAPQQEIREIGTDIRPEDSGSPSDDSKNQLSFDLHLLEQAEQSDLSNKINHLQTDLMTTENPELERATETTDDTTTETLDNSTAPSDQEAAKDVSTLTPEQKKRQKNQKNNRRLIKMLEDRYPKAFDWNNPKPLKVGIDKDMELDEQFNASKQKRALAAYTRSDRYKKCLLSGQPRFDLEGVAVSDEPALPEAARPKKAAPNKPMPKSKKSYGKENNGSSQSKHKAKPSRPAPKAKQEDEIYNKMSAEERMKAKLEKLLSR
ncbi:ProQ/FINO family protein [Marinomonas balearica]|uniref:ProP effector n=1 Tax=Marinomonas balearica TaxID=491947 RepID=A0A4R6M3X8_9GAMM|nr:ProQ/FINO family protein [Marinomonas balearica]TDO96008.1 ProP effector [Marinomonas balearica]